MAGVFRPSPPPPRLARRGAALLGGGLPTRVATAASTLGPLAAPAVGRVHVRLSGTVSLAALAGLGTVSGSGARLAIGGGLLGPVGSAAVAATGLWTSWQALRVALVPGALWDDGAGLWDGGLTPDDNDGAIWDAGSSFVLPAAVPQGAWLASPPGATTWENALR